jgi:hypothetical protein
MRHVVLVAAAIASTMALAACGGDSDHASAPRSEPARAAAGSEPGEAEGGERRDVPGVPDADRIAYYQLATTTGTLRVAVSSAAAGRARGVPRGDLAALRAADRRLRALAPRNPALRTTLAVLRPRVRRVARVRPGGRLPRRAALDALAATTRTSNELRGYLRRHPALAAKVPD